MEPKSITLLCLSESNRLPCTVNPSIHLITSSAICIITIIIMSPPPRPQHPPWSTAPTRTTPMPHTETRSWHGYGQWTTLFSTLPIHRVRAPIHRVPIISKSSVLPIASHRITEYRITKSSYRPYQLSSSCHCH